VLYGEFSSGDAIHVDFRDGEFVFTNVPRGGIEPVEESVPIEA